MNRIGLERSRGDKKHTGCHLHPACCVISVCSEDTAVLFYGQRLVDHYGRRMKFRGSWDSENTEASLVNVMISVAAVTRNVENISSLEEKLVTNGILLVLII